MIFFSPRKKSSPITHKESSQSHRRPAGAKRFRIPHATSDERNRRECTAGGRAECLADKECVELAGVRCGACGKLSTAFMI
jgi:hypothetical protein